MAAIFAAALNAQNTQPWPQQADQFRLHMVGNAHIDAVWLWPWTEADAEVHSTFRSALERMKEDPNVAMTTSSSQFYEWVAASDPELLAEIKKRVEEGRWDLVGGWWVEPDVNIPNGESLVRQGLYGQQTLKRLFGRTAKVGYNPDSFGHPGSLPQILKLEGMEDYVFMRPGMKEKTLPGSLFWWQGIDGSRVLTYRIPISYNDASNSIEPRMHDMVQVLGQEQKPLKDAMEFYGIGDHGGGPTKENLASIHRIQSEPGAPKVVFSTPDQYFAEMRASRGADFAVVNDDLQHHSAGCYTAEASIKKGNREAEAALTTAEKMAAVGALAWGASYPKDDLTEAWKRVLFLQFHDSMAGTSLPEHYDEARAGLGRALDVAHQTMYLSAVRLAWKVPTADPESSYLFIFNSHAWSTTQNVEYDLGLRSNGAYRVEDASGVPVPFQWTQATTEAQGRRRLVAQVKLPAFGYTQIRVRKVADGADSDAAQGAHLKARANLLENDLLRVTFSPQGTIGIFDKVRGKDVFRGGETGARAVIYDDQNDTWAHNVAAYTNELGQFKQDSIKLLESGPLRAVVRVRSVYGQSSITTDWILYAGSGRLMARVALDWHEHLKMLKFSFPVNVDRPEATYEIAYGAMSRATNGAEDPGQRWVEVSNAAGSGLAVINDAKYGYSVKDNDLNISVARGAVYAHHMPQKLTPDGNYYWQDQGLQTFQMMLMPNPGPWQDSGVVRAAEELVTPPLLIDQGIHPGDMPQWQSFLSVDAQDVVVSAIKMPEEGGGVIVRMYETAGRETHANLDLHFAHAHWSGTLHPFEIKTLRIDPQSGKTTEVNLLEE